MYSQSLVKIFIYQNITLYVKHVKYSMSQKSIHKKVSKMYISLKAGLLNTSDLLFLNIEVFAPHEMSETA